MTYVPANFALSNGSEDAFTRKYIIWPWPQGQGHMKCCLVPSTSCDLCIGKFWIAVSKSLWGDAFTRKYIIWPLTMTSGSRSHKTSPSTLDIMWPMHRQNLKLLLPKVYEEMHLQEKTLFDPWPWGQGHTKSHPVPSTSCDLCIYKVWGCYVQLFRRRYNYKKHDGRMARQTDAWTDDGRTLKRN